MKIVICFDRPKAYKNPELNTAALTKKYVNGLLAYFMKAHYTYDLAEYTGDAEQYVTQVQILQPNLLWNAFTSFNGDECMACRGAMLLDQINVPCTGNPAQTLLACTDSIGRNTIFRNAGLPSTPFYTAGDKVPADISGDWLLKPVKYGNDVVMVSPDNLKNLERNLVSLSESGLECYAEEVLTGQIYDAVLFNINEKFQVVAIAKETETGYDFKLTDDEVAMSTTINKIALACISPFRLTSATIVKIIKSPKYGLRIHSINASPIPTKDSLLAQSCEQIGVEFDEILDTFVHGN